MKRLLTILLLSILPFSCAKKVVLPPQEKKIELQVCDQWPIDRDASRKPVKPSPSYYVTLTAMDYRTVLISYKVPNSNTLTITRTTLSGPNIGAVSTIYTCSGCPVSGMRQDFPVSGGTTYRYTVNSVSNTVTTPDAPPDPGGSQQAVIFFSFRGDTVSSGPWLSYNNNQPIYASPAGLTVEAEDAIVQIARDQATASEANVIITKDPSVYYNTSPLRRHKCIITQTNFYYGAGGIAYTNTFGQPGYESWVFSNALGYNINYIGHSAIHEALGHATSGLTHLQDGSDQNWMGYAFGYPWGQLRFFKVVIEINGLSRDQNLAFRTSVQ